MKNQEKSKWLGLLSTLLFLTHTTTTTSSIVERIRLQRLHAEERAKKTEARDALVKKKELGSMTIQTLRTKLPHGAVSALTGGVDEPTVIISKPLPTTPSIAQIAQPAQPIAHNKPAQTRPINRISLKPQQTTETSEGYEIITTPTPPPTYSNNPDQRLSTRIAPGESFAPSGLLQPPTSTTTQAISLAIAGILAGAAITGGLTATGIATYHYITQNQKTARPKNTQEVSAQRGRRALQGD